MHKTLWDSGIRPYRSSPALAGGRRGLAVVRAWQTTARQSAGLLARGGKGDQRISAALLTADAWP
jgi:hypothetical protein